MHDLGLALHQLPVALQQIRLDVGVYGKGEDRKLGHRGDVARLNRAEMWMRRLWVIQQHDLKIEKGNDYYHACLLIVLLWFTHLSLFDLSPLLTNIYSTHCLSHQSQPSSFPPRPQSMPKLPLCFLCHSALFLKFPLGRKRKAA